MDNSIIQLNSFTGMDNGSVYYLEGLSPINVAGRRILTAGFGAQYKLSEEVTGYSAFDGANAMVSTSFNSDLVDRLFAIGTDHIHAFLRTSGTLGLAHTITTTGSGTDKIMASTKPDMMVTTNNHILYASAHHLGIAYKFVATSATSTSLVVSGATLNATYGIDNNTGDSTIYNVTKNEVYINTTNNPTDTLNFTAATTTPEAGDVFLVFIDNKFKFNVSDIVSNHFGNQSVPSEWIRQIKLVGSDYWILNGNYIASLNIDGATFAATAKQLPYNTNATCFSDNNGMMLVGGSFNGRGKLMLWNTYEDGWLSIIEINKAPSAITAYKNGWLVSMGSVLYFTDGYQVQELSKFPDVDNYRATLNVHYNGMLVVEDRLLMNVQTNDIYRARTGTAVYDFGLGWSYFPPVVDSGGKTALQGSAGCLHYSVGRDNGIPLLYLSFFGTEYTNSNVINTLANNAYGEKSVMFCFDLPKKVRVNKVELKVSFKFNNTTYDDTPASVTMNYGDGKRLLFSEYTVGATSTASVIKNTSGDTKTPLVGQSIRILGGLTCGERSYIDSIANSGTITEAWTISPALSAVPTTSKTIAVCNLYKSETKTIPATKITDNLTFNVKDFYSDKLYVEFVFDGAERMNLDILGINVY